MTIQDKLRAITSETILFATDIPKESPMNINQASDSQENSPGMNSLVITLTNQRPIRIIVEEWPIVAQSECLAVDGDPSYPMSLAESHVIVRQHEGNYFLVCGFYSLIYHTKKFDDADREYQVTHGELVRNMSNDYEHDESWMDVVDAIHRVVLQLASAIPSERNIIDARGVGELERKCIASLPVHDFVLWTR